MITENERCAIDGTTFAKYVDLDEFWKMTNDDVIAYILAKAPAHAEDSKLAWCAGFWAMMAGRLRDENAKLIAAGNSLRDKTDWYCDEGPAGEGWQSEELKKAFADWDALAKKGGK